MSKTRLEEIRGRLEKASPAPWKWFVWEPKGCGEVSWESGNGHCSIVGDNAVAMTRIFGAAQSDLAYLLSQIDTLTREKNALTQTVLNQQASFHELISERDEAREALRPFAACMKYGGNPRTDDLTPYDFRRAASVLTPPAQSRGVKSTLAQEVMSGETPSDGNAFVSRDQINRALATLVEVHDAAGWWGVAREFATLTAALRRLASMQAFEMPRAMTDSAADQELLARIKFASAALGEKPGA